jgi:hypothetical protein
MKPMATRAGLGLIVVAALCMAAVPTMAQRNGNYQVQEMNFDLWCQEQAGLPADRCDKRTAQDEAAFEAYRAKVEAYEIPYLQKKNEAARLDRDILRNDPVDRPTSTNPTPNRPDLNSPSTTVPPRP